MVRNAVILPLAMVLSTLGGNALGADAEEARRLCEEAEHYMEGSHGCTLSVSKAIECYRRAAEAGSAEAAYELAMLTFDGGDFTYEMSILKSADAEGTACSRFTFSYPALSGVGHFLHTYVTDGNPVIPTFQGEPERVAVGNDPEAFASQVWDSLNADNKVSLYINWIDLATGEESVRIFNKNQ